MSTLTADYFPVDPDADMPSPIVLRLESYCNRLRAQDKRGQRENALQAFENAWFRGTEMELHECEEKLHVV